MAKSIFADAPIAPTPKKKGGKQARTVKMPGLRNLNEVTKAVAVLMAVRETLVAEIKEKMISEFIQTGVATKQRPDNFVGEDGDETASCQLRKRSSASSLSPEEIEICKKHNIPLDTNVSQSETFIFNSAYLSDTKLMAKIEAALSKVPGLPADLIMKQPEISKTFTNDQSLDKMFMLGESAVQELIGILGVTAITPRFSEESDMVGIMTRVWHMVGASASLRDVARNAAANPISIIERKRKAA